MNIEFSKRELTAQELSLIQRLTKESSVELQIQFIVSRAARVIDMEILVRGLYFSPASEIMRLFHIAVIESQPETNKAYDRVAAEFGFAPDESSEENNMAKQTDTEDIHFFDCNRIIG